MIWIMLLMILYLCLRVFRYRIASSAAALRLSWYAYYVPLMLVPALFLMVCFRISSTGLKSVKWDERLLLIPGGGTVHFASPRRMRQQIFPDFGRYSSCRNDDACIAGGQHFPDG